MKKFDWDNLLFEEMKNMWIKFFVDIKRFKYVEFLRCFKLFIIIGLFELYVFIDVSISVYGVIVYLLWFI